MPSHMRDDSAPTPRPEPSQPLEPRDPQPDLPDDLQPDEPELDRTNDLKAQEPEPGPPDDRLAEDLQPATGPVDPDEDRESPEAFGEMPDPASPVSGPEDGAPEPEREVPEAEPSAAAEPEGEIPEGREAPEPPEPFEPEETQQAPQAAEQRAEQPLPIDAEERREEAERLAEELREEEEEEPERSGITLWWAALIVAAIVIVGVLFIWLFLIPRMSGGYTDVQGIEEQPAQEEVVEGEGAEEEVPAEGTENAEGAETVEEGRVIGSTGPTSLVSPDGTAWNANVVDMLTPVELHGVSSHGVSIAFMPDPSMPLVNVRITSLQVGDQYYPVGTPDSPVHYQITAGPDGERDITGDPTFTVGVNADGVPYAQRVLVSVDGLSKEGYNGMIMSVDETPEGGETQAGTILLSSVTAS